MTELDDKFFPKVKTLIDRFGKSMTFKLKTAYTFDDVTGIGSDGGTTTVVAKASPPFPFSKNSFASEFVNNDLILAGDVEIYLAAKGLTFNPVLVMVVTIDTIDWTAIRINPIYAGELIVVYQIQLRR